ncbi:hypothetical protein GE09DRAFT_189444 [Coniochaeta sp. 2T2.1]|nr:hypothetical protein GE09DRAFT_189444 [Coniochaeta sp. 2T2.1]
MMAKRGPDIRILAALMLLILALLPGTDAHSGVERLIRIAINGTMIGPEGFPRGFWPRTAPGYYDNGNYHLIPANSDHRNLTKNDPLAHEYQRVSNYTEKNPPLKAAPGDMVALQYQENGHTTKPNPKLKKPLNRGTVWIYGTSNLKGDTPLLDVLYSWNVQGTGGNGNGKLLATRNFDDGHCHEVNDGPIATQRTKDFEKPAEDPMGANLWCQTDLALPNDLPAGQKYTLIWIWDWPSMLEPNVAIPPSSARGAPPSEEGVYIEYPEIYVTVMDIDIVDPCDNVLGDVKGPTCSQGGKGAKTKYVVTEKDYNKAAIQDQLVNMFMVDPSTLTGVGNGNAENPAAPAPSSDASLPSGTASSSSICTKSGDPKVTTTTLTSGGSIATTSAPGNEKPAPSSTTTLVETMTVTTVTVTGSSSAPETANGPVVVTVTVTTYDTTVTETVPPSSSSAVASTPTATSIASGRPTVTSFLKDTKPTTTAINKNRRAIGQWGFGARGGGGGQQGA